MQSKMEKRVCIVHYNTPELTTAAIKSLWKHTPGCIVTVFDNSDKYPFPHMDGVTIIDNTKKQICDFDKWLSVYPNKINTGCNWGSEKHMWSIEYLYQHSDEGFLLLDSDVIVKRDVSCFFDDKYAWVGMYEDQPRNWNCRRRLAPYCLWINVPMCKKRGIVFMSEGRIHKISHSGPPWYDTGASFYEDCNKLGLTGNNIHIYKYIEHFGRGSHSDGNKSWRAWLEKYKNLYSAPETKKKTVAIVHYNTPDLTTALIMSIRKHTPDCRIIVLDNSDKYSLQKIDGVEILDNTKEQLIGFTEWLEKYPNKVPYTVNWGSEKHILSVQYLFDKIEEGFLLMDSDILIKKDISCFFDYSVAWKGQIELKPEYWFKSQRVYPFLMWINVPMCKKHNIRFAHEGRIYKVSHTGPPYYDTGGSFYFDCKDAGLPFSEININDYMVHLLAGSHHKQMSDVKQWLLKYRYLYEDTNMEEKKSGEKILVVIPYCSEGAQGRELEYAVAGWRRHFKENYLIVLAGEDHPITKTGDDIMCIESKRVEPIEGMYRQHLDYVSCFKKVRKAFPDSKGFIFVADDVYAVNDFDMSDVMFLKQREPTMNPDPNSSNKWIRDKYRTVQLLKKEGYPIRGFTTHLPQWFEWDKLEALWDKYDMEHNSYVFEDLYYNIYYPARIPFQLDIDHDNLKCGVYRKNPRIDYIRRAFKEKIWIQNSNEGWIPELDKMLADYYGI